MKPGRILLQFVSLVLGILCFGASVLIRVAPAFISVGSWRIFLKFFRPELVDWIQVPLSPVLVLVVALLAGLVFLTPTGKAFAGVGCATTAGTATGRSVPFLVLGITLLPPSHPADNLYLAGQELATSVILGSAGIAFLLFGLGRALDPAG